MPQTREAKLDEGEEREEGNQTMGGKQCHFPKLSHGKSLVAMRKWLEFLQPQKSLEPLPRYFFLSAQIVPSAGPSCGNCKYQSEVNASGHANTSVQKEQVCRVL